MILKLFVYHYRMRKNNFPMQRHKPNSVCKIMKNISIIIMSKFIFFLFVLFILWQQIIIILTKINSDKMKHCNMNIESLKISMKNIYGHMENAYFNWNTYKRSYILKHLTTYWNYMAMLLYSTNYLVAIQQNQLPS